MNKSDINFIHRDFDLEAFARLFNARPVVMIVVRGTDKPFKVGRLDDNNNLKVVARRGARSEAMHVFADLCSLWADGEMTGLEEIAS